MEEKCWIGQTNFRNRRQKFYIKPDDRRRHCYCIGMTGVGKSTLLENMAIQDIKAGHGVCFIDAHGQSAETILRSIPPNRINDVIFFNPGDLDYPISWNPLENVKDYERDVVCESLISVFYKIWKDSWGPRLEYILKFAIYALLEYKGGTLLGINRMVSDEHFRNTVLNHSTNPAVKYFWQTEFKNWNDRDRREAISPIQNKAGVFGIYSVTRNIFGQVKSSFNLRDVMDSGKILICNLSKGKIGEGTMTLMGSIIITKLYLAAMSRQDIPENERKDFYAYVDEFQNFATDSFANILSEARKYRLSLVLANQYLDQLIEEVRNAVLGNCGTLISFRTGATDGEILEKELLPFRQEDFVNLPKYSCYVKLLIDGLAGDAFSACTLPPIGTEEGNDEKVVRQSRERYCRQKSEIERKLNGGRQ